MEPLAFLCLLGLSFLPSCLCPFLPSTLWHSLLSPPPLPLSPLPLLPLLLAQAPFKLRLNSSSNASIQILLVQKALHSLLSK